MKWVAQVSEYWPLSKLASLSEDDMSDLLEGEVPETPLTQSLMDLNLSPSVVHSLPGSKRGRIFLVGSGPGLPSLLTQATHTVLTRLADLVLSDKLVPDAVLALIPKGVEVRIAKKFPGNAEGAQQEMMEAAIEAANRGLTVVRVSPSFLLSCGVQVLTILLNSSNKATQLSTVAQARKYSTSANTVSNPSSFPVSAPPSLPQPSPTSLSPNAVPPSRSLSALESAGGAKRSSSLRMNVEGLW
jgi:hypothetical protein